MTKRFEKMTAADLMGRTKQIPTNQDGKWENTGTKRYEKLAIPELMLRTKHISTNQQLREIKGLNGVRKYD